MKVLPLIPRSHKYPIRCSDKYPIPCRHKYPIPCRHKYPIHCSHKYQIILILTLILRSRSKYPIPCHVLCHLTPHHWKYLTSLNLALLFPSLNYLQLLVRNYPILLINHSRKYRTTSQLLTRAMKAWWSTLLTRTRASVRAPSTSATSPRVGGVGARSSDVTAAATTATNQTRASRCRRLAARSSR